MDTREIVKHTVASVLVCLVLGISLGALVTVIVKGQTGSEGDQLEGSSNCSCLDRATRFLPTLSPQDTEKLNKTAACLMSSCSNNREELSGVFGAVFDRQDSEQRKLKKFLESRVYLRKMMVPSSTGDYGPVKLKFNTGEMGTTELDLIGLTLSADKAYIHQSGIYYVSSVVHFQINDTGFYSQDNNKTLNYTARLTRRTQALSQVLYQILFRCCINCVEILETKYYGGVFQLEEGDVIDSFISHADTVKHVYFNLYLLLTL